MTTAMFALVILTVLNFLTLLINALPADAIYRITPQDVQPQQIHLSFSENPFGVVVTWSTTDLPNATSTVEYGLSEESLIYSTSGFSTEFIDGGAEQRRQFIHRATLSDLKPGRKYYYHCGSDLGWSSLYHFISNKPTADWSPRLAVYGDLGADNPQSLPRLQREAQEGLYDAVYHVGDFGYDMYEEDGRLGDRFMREIEPLAAYVPYMTAVGNHEEKYNFSHYKSRFSMPGSENSLMYSFNLGPAHIITISTEFYYFLNYGFKQIVKQYDWLINDLKEANLAENRLKRPWIIIGGHRPMYCSNGEECDDVFMLTRLGIPPNNWFALEPLLYQYGVDLALWAHEHSYERMWPVYNKTVMNGTLGAYVNPRATVHVVTGSAGCREEKRTFSPDKPDWSAFRSTDYGYSRLHIVNKSHIHMEQVSDDQQGKIIDEFWLKKDDPWSFLQLNEL